MQMEARRMRTVLAAAVVAVIVTGAPVDGQPGRPDAPKRERAVSTRAAGEFDVKLAPLALSAEGTGLGRMSIDKQFRGDLVATSKGEMLTAGTAVKTSAVYVAVEQVTGTLHGRAGSFMLHHTGIMTRGTPSLTIRVVPDSGTGELTGISGTLDIVIADGKHTYTFDYTLAPER
jgi:Protein of unknown function (DUF3224)